MNGDRLLKMAYVLGNADAYALIEAGVLLSDSNGNPKVGGSDWARFNEDLTTFIIKLPPERREALAKFIEENM